MSVPAHVVPRSTGVATAERERGAGLARQHQVGRYLDPWGSPQIVWCHGHTLLRGYKVILNIYDLLPPQMNGCLVAVGLGGAFHSGLEVGGTEFAFGGHWSEEAGIMELPLPLHALRRQAERVVELGEDEDGSAAEALAALPPLRSRAVVGWWMGPLGDLQPVLRHLHTEEQWVGPAYRLLTRNCNHFTRALCEVLLRCPHFKPAPGTAAADRMVPPPVTRLSQLAVALGRCLPCCTARLNVPMPLAPYALHVFQGRGRTCRTAHRGGDGPSRKPAARNHTSSGSSNSSGGETQRRPHTHTRTYTYAQGKAAAESPDARTAALAAGGAAAASRWSSAPPRLRLDNGVITICSGEEEGAVREGRQLAGGNVEGRTGEGDWKAAGRTRGSGSGEEDAGRQALALAVAVAAARAEAAAEAEAAGRQVVNAPRAQVMGRYSSSSAATTTMTSRTSEGMLTSAMPSHMPTITELGVLNYRALWGPVRDNGGGAGAAAGSADAGAKAGGAGARSGYDGPNSSTHREPSGPRRPRSASSGPHAATSQRPFGSGGSSSSIGIEVMVPSTEAASPPGAAAKLLAHSRSGRRVFPDPRAGLADGHPAAADHGGGGGGEGDGSITSGDNVSGKEAHLLEPGTQPPPPSPSEPKHQHHPLAVADAAGVSVVGGGSGGAAAAAAPSGRPQQRQRLSPLPQTSPRSALGGPVLPPPAPAAASNPSLSATSIPPQQDPRAGSAHSITIPMPPSASATATAATMVAASPRLPPKSPTSPALSPVKVLPSPSSQPHSRSSVSVLPLQHDLPPHNQQPQQQARPPPPQHPHQQKSGSPQPQPENAESPRPWSVMSGGFIDLLFARSALTTPEPLPPPPPVLAPNDANFLAGGSGGGSRATYTGGCGSYTGMAGGAAAAAAGTTFPEPTSRPHPQHRQQLRQLSGPVSSGMDCTASAAACAVPGVEAAAAVAAAAAGGAPRSKAVELGTLSESGLHARSPSSHSHASEPRQPQQQQLSPRQERASVTAARVGASERPGTGAGGGGSQAGSGGVHKALGVEGGEEGKGQGPPSPVDRYEIMHAVKQCVKSGRRGHEEA